MFGQNPSLEQQKFSAAVAEFGKTNPEMAKILEGVNMDTLPGNSWLDKFTAPVGGLDGLGTIAKGIGSLGQVYGAVKGVQLAEDQLKFSKDAYKTNLNNQRSSFNTNLEDRIRARYHTEGRSNAEVNKYLAKHSL